MCRCGWSADNVHRRHLVRLDGTGATHEMLEHPQQLNTARAGPSGNRSNGRSLTPMKGVAELTGRRSKALPGITFGDSSMITVRATSRG
jgi:hypothetical protein